MLQILFLLIFGWLLQNNEPSQFPYWDRVPDNEITWHPNGNHLAIATSHGLWVYNLQNDEASLISDCGRATFTPMFNHEGDHLAYNTNEPVVRLVDWITQTEIIQFDVFGETVFSVAFDPKKTYLAIASGKWDDMGFYIADMKIEIWDYQANQFVRGIDNIRHVITEVQFDTDADVIWVAGVSSGLDTLHAYLWNIDIHTGQVISHYPLQYIDASRLRMDGPLIVYSIENYNSLGVPHYKFLIWDFKSYYNRFRETYYDESIYVFDLTYLGERFAMITRDGRVRVFPIYSRDNIYELDIQQIEALAVRFSPNGEYLAIQSRDELPEVEIWDMKTMTHSMTLRTADWYQADCGE